MLVHVEALDGSSLRTCVVHSHLVVRRARHNHITTVAVELQVPDPNRLAHAQEHWLCVARPEDRRLAIHVPDLQIVLLPAHCEQVGAGRGRAHARKWASRRKLDHLCAILPIMQRHGAVCTRRHNVLAMHCVQAHHIREAPRQRVGPVGRIWIPDLNLSVSVGTADQRLWVRLGARPGHVAHRSLSILPTPLGCLPFLKVYDLD
mmetsp:Transcript_18385/g.58619  ORF Transcript_18385/g.58619 Transcript_18385/m.58619 type:complete len:204 (-) Transcript_18385:34-645(-)